jgi:hypothetical protein
MDQACALGGVPVGDGREGRESESGCVVVSSNCCGKESYAGQQSRSSPSAKDFQNSELCAAHPKKQNHQPQ